MMALLAAGMLCTGAQAQEDTGEEIRRIEESGVAFVMPEEYTAAQGTIQIDGGEFNYGDGVYVTSFDYIAMEAGELEAFLSAEDHTEEELQAYYSVILPMAYILGINDNRDDEDLVSYLAQYGIAVSGLEEIGSDGASRFYLLRGEELVPDDAARELGEFGEEYLSLREQTDLILDNVSVFEPKSAMDSLKEEGVFFETTDLEGNAINSKELFGESKVTMVNIWTTWCGYCIQEMPELEEIYQTYRDSGVNVVGLLYDGTDEAAVEEAGEIIADTGVTYTSILPWEGYEEMFPVQGFPTTLFIDSSGAVMTDEVVGADVQRYISTLDELLAAEE